MSDLTFTTRFTLNDCCKPDYHGHKSKVYGNVTDFCRADLDDNTLDVPEHPSEEWCVERGGSQQLVIIPVYCKDCNVWTIHAYSDFGKGSEWTTFRFAKFGGIKCVDFKFMRADNQSKPLCDLVEMVVEFGHLGHKSFSFWFPITEFSNLPLFTFKVELLKAFLQDSSLMFRLYGMSRRYAKLCRTSQETALQNFFARLASYASNAELLKQTAVKTVEDIYRLRKSSGGPSLQSPREALQLAVLRLDPTAREAFLGASIPIPEPKESQSGDGYESKGTGE